MSLRRYASSEDDMITPPSSIATIFGDMQSEKTEEEIRAIP
jgi:hypothetical protein